MLGIYLLQDVLGGLPGGEGDAALVIPEAALLAGGGALSLQLDSSCDCSTHRLKVNSAFTFASCIRYIQIDMDLI
jgi:hypothetical protein